MVYVVVKMEEKKMIEMSCFVKERRRRRWCRWYSGCWKLGMEEGMLVEMVVEMVVWVAKRKRSQWLVAAVCREEDEGKMNEREKMEGGGLYIREGKLLLQVCHPFKTKETHK